MPRPLPPFLQREHARGKTYWYVRVNRGKRIRIRAAFDTPEFWSAYQAALDGRVTTPKRGAGHGTFAWLVERYRETSAWQSLALSTRRQRDNILKHAIDSVGREPLSAITRDVIVRSREARKDRPAAARNYLRTMRGLFAWALDAGHVRVDPTAGVKPVKLPRTSGFPMWTEEEIARYEQRWPIGTKERVWLDVLLYTGLRRGDAVRLGRQHIRDGVATISTEKTGTTVVMPILPALRRTLDVGPCGDLALICGERRQPMTKESFGNVFGEAARAAGVRKSAHGLRKAGATRAANAGATVAELEAIFGWHGGRMASHYTKGADRAHLARRAMEKLDRPEREHFFPNKRT